MWASLAVEIFARPWARQLAGFGLAALTITLFIINLRRAAKREAQVKVRQGLLDAAGHFANGGSMADWVAKYSGATGAGGAPEDDAEYLKSLGLE